MSRIVKQAGAGMILTDGVTYGSTIFLAEGESGEAYEEIPEEEFLRRAESGSLGKGVTEADYQEALRAMGVQL